MDKNTVCLNCAHPRHMHREYGPYHCMTKHMTCPCRGFTVRDKTIKMPLMIEVGGYGLAGNSHDRRVALRAGKEIYVESDVEVMVAE